MLSCAIVRVMREMAFRMSSDSVGVGPPIHLAAMFVTRLSLTGVLTVSMLRSRWNIRAIWAGQYSDTPAGGDGGRKEGY